jgi:oligopeptide transport system ATP-binding protein
MYLGKIVELAPAAELYSSPLMPYTRALISAVPVPEPDVERARERLILGGDVPSPIDPPSGCRFHTRCPFVIDECRRVVPALRLIKPDHDAACIRISPDQPDIVQKQPKASVRSTPDRRLNKKDRRKPAVLQQQAIGAMKRIN